MTDRLPPEPTVAKPTPALPGSLIPIHPQPGPGGPDRLRWIMPLGTLPVAGRVHAAPAALMALIEDGTLAEVAVERAAVVTRLGPGRTWAAEGPRVRTALHAALAQPDGWVCDHRDADEDAALCRAAKSVIEGTVGLRARSHGGGIELIGAQDGVVSVRLYGACHGCPAARVTLNLFLERELRQRWPALRAVRSVRSGGES